MKDLNTNELMTVDGGGWLGDLLEGAACGATVVAAVAATVSPEPMSKAAVYLLWAGAVGTCASAFN